MSDRPLRIAFAGGGSGGHLYPGIAVARALESLSPGAEIVFLGSDRPLERKILGPTGYRHEALPAAPWRGVRRVFALGRFGWQQLRGAWRARGIFREFDPHVVLGLGGFASVPGVLAGRLRGCPVALFEPNAVAGRANQVLAPLAREAYVHFQETALRCPRFRSGVPLGDRALRGPDAPLARARLGLPTNRPVVLIMGGSQGALGINRWVEASLRAGAAAEDVSYLHLAGSEDAARPLRAAYTAAGVAHAVLPFLAEIGVAYAAADVAIVRAGAATLAELSAVGIPGLAIPLHGLAGGHQERNARAYSTSGGGAWIRETALTPETLRCVSCEARDPSRVAVRSNLAQAAGLPDAARDVALRLMQLAGDEQRTLGRSDAPAHQLTRAA